MPGKKIPVEVKIYMQCKSYKEALRKLGLIEQVGSAERHRDREQLKDGASVILRTNDFAAEIKMLKEESDGS